MTRSRQGGELVPANLASALAGTIVLGTIAFNFVLCFVNTNAFRVNVGLVMLAELVLIGAALVVAASRSTDVLVLVLGVLAYGLAVGLVQGAPDPKGIRDILIVVVFLYAGRCVQDLRTADRIVWIAVIAVLVVGICEYLFLPAYTRIFDILGYYVSRGTVAAASAETSSQRLFISGMRYEGRTLAAFLGEHRVSSIFLEPVSVGNFGAVATAWIVLRNWGRWGGMALRLLPVIAIFCLADARFGLFVSLTAFPIYLLAPYAGRIPVLIAPFAVIIVLATIGFLFPDTPWDNGLAGRILLSGQMISRLDFWEIMGFLRYDGFTSDSGYAYTLTKLGLGGFAGLWILFVLYPCRDLEAWRFRLFVAVYVTLLLTISNSIYSIKTAGLLWFLLGSLSPLAAPSVRRDPAPAPRHAATA